MKTKQIGLIALLAIITLALIACKEDDPPPPEEPVATTADLTMGDVKITLHYKKKPSEPVPAYVDRIQNRLTSMAGNPGNAELMSDLKNRNGNYSINVIYDGTPFEAFRAVDGQTIEAHDSWLMANAETIESAKITRGLQAMLALPPLDENGVPYYGTLPNTTIKIYKGDATLTDAQMTTAVTTTTNAFGRLRQTDKTAVNNELTKIRIISNKEYTWDGHILGLRFDIDEETLLGGFQAIAGDCLPLAE